MTDGASVTSSVRIITVTQLRPGNDDFENRIVLAGEVAESRSTSPTPPWKLTSHDLFRECGKNSMVAVVTIAQNPRHFRGRPAPQTNALISLFTGSQVESLYFVNKGVVKLCNWLSANGLSNYRGFRGGHPVGLRTVDRFE